MPKSLPLSPAFLSALEGFLIKANGMIAADYAKHYPNLEPPILCPDAKGLKYIRIVSHDRSGSRSSYCFIDKANGDVLKCEGWKKPAKHARGNIFSASNGLEGVGVHGANYLI
jgi:hypothetical protein